VLYGHQAGDPPRQCFCLNWRLAPCEKVHMVDSRAAYTALHPSLCGVVIEVATKLARSIDLCLWECRVLVS
jgi:hypothetical protein